MSATLRAMLQRQRLAAIAHDYDGFNMLTRMIYAVAAYEGRPFSNIFFQTGETR